MFYSYTVMGTSRLPLNIDNEAINKCLGQLIAEFGKTFSYHELYERFKYAAMSNEWFKKEPYTQYSNIELTDEDTHKITAYLWKLIWDRKLMIEFYHNEYRSNYPNDYILSKVDF